jgi:hypothetical protein
MLEFKGQAEILDKVVKYVTHPQYPRGVIIVLPPCFGEATIAARLEQLLAEQSPRPAVAMVEADMVRSRQEYVQRLHEKWRLDGAPAPGECTTSVGFERYLGSLPRTRPFVQVVTRFHKLLDHLDPFILGSLRSKEQDRAIRSIIISPYGYADLKRHWRQHADKLSISNYGEKHYVVDRIEPLSRDEILAARHGCGVPRHVLEFAAEVSGGLPELFEDVLERYAVEQHPDLSPAMRESLTRGTLPLARHFVELLDPEGEHHYQRAVAEVALTGCGAAAMSTLATHPWSSCILGPEGLLSPVVGRVAIEYEMATSASADLFAQGRLAYGARNWIDAERFLARSTIPVARLLRIHALVMADLGGGSGRRVSLDAHWQRAKTRLSEAVAVAKELGLRDELLESRYEELEELTNAAHFAAKKGATRIIDGLAGLDARVSAAPLQALVMLVAALESARQLRGNREAVQSVIALPEQIFRLFAWWNLRVRQDKAPEWDEDTAAAWQDVADVWRDPLPSPPPSGAPFASFVIFALFAMALALRRSLRGLPWTTLVAFERELAFLDARRDGAHALSSVSPDRRREFFARIDKWLPLALLPNDTFSTAPDVRLLRQCAEPLPAFSDRGEIEWP